MRHDSRIQKWFLVGTILTLAILYALVLTACAPAAAPTPVPATKAPAATAPTPVAATSAPAAAVPGVTDSEIVIGSWGPQDGPAGAYGVIDRTIAGFFDKVNAEGGINGRKVRFIYENDSYQPAKTVAAVKKLVEEDKVFALVSGLGTANNLAVMDYLVQNNVPHVGPATGTTALAVPLKKNVYAVQLNYATEATLLTQYAIDKLGSKKFAVFYQNDSFGKEGLDTVNAVLKKDGIAQATGVSYETADTNFSAQALKLQTTGADTVVLWAVPKPGGSVLAEMNKIGYTPKILASAVLNDPSIFQLAGPGIDGVIIPAWLPAFDDLTNPKIVQWQADMKKYAPKEQLGGFALSGWAEAQILTEGLRRAGKNLTRESFEQAMDQMKDYKDSILPTISYSPTDHGGTKTAYFQKADSKSGKWVTFTDWMSVR
ncbi:MAG: ABC transporter substrate-binding protein [Chloroflexi bacterium]|nr:ABC transporter substrate-binding protein [Chloroflexota bacterium]